MNHRTFGDTSQPPNLQTSGRTPITPRTPLPQRTAQPGGEGAAEAAIFKPPEISDWHIPEADHAISDGLLYPGPKLIPPQLISTAVELRELAIKAAYIRDASGAVVDILKDYRIFHGSQVYRGHRQHNTEGILHILRAVGDPPPFSSLGIPEQVQRLLLSRDLGDVGGLVIISGEPGHGKSTTSAAMIVKRVKQNASFCLTVEDPPEFVMAGNYVTANNTVGKIIQVPASSKSFAEDLRDALRCYPSNTRGAMLFVGEVRDSDSAVQVLRAAANGLLVIMTTHAGSPLQACSRITSLASGGLSGQSEAAELLGATVRAIIHQRLKQGNLEVQHLFSISKHSNVGSIIASGGPKMLSTELHAQATHLRLGTLEQYVLHGSATGDRYA